MVSTIWGHYKLNEATGNALDSSGNSNDLTENGTVPSQTGKITNARGVFASGNYFQRTSITGFDNTQSFSITGWLYAVSVAAGDKYAIVAEGTSGTFQLFIDYNDPNLIFKVGKNGVAVDTASVAGNFSAGNWYWFSCTYNGSTGAMEVDVNNSGSPGTGTYEQGVTATFPTIVFAAYNTLTTYYLDDVRIYTDVLTSDEMDFIYNSGNGTENNLGADTFSATALTLSTSLGTPTYAFDFVHTVSALSLSSSLETSIINLDFLHTVSALSLSSSLETSIINLDFLHTVSALSLSSSLETSIINLDFLHTVSALSLSASLETPSVYTGLFLSVSALNLSSTTNEPNYLIDGTVSITALELTLSQKEPVIVLGKTFIASALNLSSSIKSPSVLFDFTYLASTIKLVSNLNSPSIRIPFNYTATLKFPEQSVKMKLHKRNL